jgi:hypothetical protein
MWGQNYHQWWSQCHWIIDAIPAFIASIHHHNAPVLSCQIQCQRYNHRIIVSTIWSIFGWMYHTIDFWVSCSVAIVFCLDRLYNRSIYIIIYWLLVFWAVFSVLLFLYQWHLILASCPNLSICWYCQSYKSCHRWSNLCQKWNICHQIISQDLGAQYDHLMSIYEIQYLWHHLFRYFCISIDVICTWTYWLCRMSKNGYLWTDSIVFHLFIFFVFLSHLCPSIAPTMIWPHHIYWFCPVDTCQDDFVGHIWCYLCPITRFGWSYIYSWKWIYYLGRQK